MALAAGSGTLHHAMKMLLIQWEDAKTRWNDRIAQIFEKEYLVPLQEQFAQTLQEANRLAEQLSKARKDCSS